MYEWIGSYKWAKLHDHVYLPAQPIETNCRPLSSIIELLWVHTLGNIQALAIYSAIFVITSQRRLNVWGYMYLVYMYILQCDTIETNCRPALLINYWYLHLYVHAHEEIPPCYICSKCYAFCWWEKYHCRLEWTYNFLRLWVVAQGLKAHLLSGRRMGLFSLNVVKHSWTVFAHWPKILNIWKLWAKL